MYVVLVFVVQKYLVEEPLVASEAAKPHSQAFASRLWREARQLTAILKNPDSVESIISYAASLSFPGLSWVLYLVWVYYSSRNPTLNQNRIH
jgi:hypothetical protein